MKNTSTFRLSVLVFGFAFLYVPILSLIVYSFNKSRLVTVWAGFSTVWYGRLLDNNQVLDAAWLSLKIAAINATGAVILGTLAGLALARFGKFRGRTLLSGMTTAPLVMPEVSTGLSRLAGRPRRYDHHHRSHDADDCVRHRDRAVAPGDAR